ncbi:MAG: hypothetical protein U1E05_11190 [Patescibacteria group bacterium]|nr:hypothetical protein [Patescibacteria group bacterium]
MDEYRNTLDWRRRPRRPRAVWSMAAALLVLTCVIGCGKGERDLAPLTGTVLYNGTPLTFGAVMIEHDHGQPATAAIRPDGTFAMATHGEGEGAVVGKRRIRVACYQGQDPAAPMSDTLGESLIPERYTSFETSGLEVDIKPDGNEPLELTLTDR